jgi:hypothetical protein
MGLDAYTNGEFVEIIEKISNAPAPAPAKKVVVPQVEQMVIEGLPEPKDFTLPLPRQAYQENINRWRGEYSGDLVRGLNKYLPRLKRDGANYHGPEWVKPYAKVFKEKFNKIEPSPFGNNQKITKQDVLDKITEETKKWTNDASSFIRVHKRNFPKILNDGRLKTQFETKASGGMMDNRHRADFEQNVFSYPENMDVTKRPVYGYAAKDKKGKYPKGERQLAQYGKIRLKLKGGTRNRTTVTFDDSLHGSDSHMPTPFDNPTHESQPIYDKYMLPFLKGETRSNYVEVQVHGGVTLDDISHVYFPEGLSPTPEQKKFLTEKGIKWTMD